MRSKIHLYRRSPRLMPTNVQDKLSHQAALIPRAQS
jgi:hypothetical protein